MKKTYILKKSHCRKSKDIQVLGLASGLVDGISSRQRILTENVGVCLFACQNDLPDITNANILLLNLQLSCIKFNNQPCKWEI